MSNVAILGAGPAALFAALAVEQSHHTPVIYARGEQSKMFGAMYLHRAIPGLSYADKPDFEIDIIKVGSKEGYAYNVYGNKEAACSWDFFTAGSVPAWDLKAHYYKLWDYYAPKIRQVEVKPGVLGEICSMHPLVLCSIPATLLCTRDHMFKFQDIWVIHGEGTHLIEGVNDDNMMYYNGVPSDGSFSTVEGEIPVDDDSGHGATFLRGHGWYRFSQINRYQAWEYSTAPDWSWEDAEPGRTLSSGQKPLWTNCGCFSEFPSFNRIGRFGRWHKGVLTHHSYELALELCRAL